MSSKSPGDQQLLNLHHAVFTLLDLPVERFESTLERVGSAASNAATVRQPCSGSLLTVDFDPRPNIKCILVDDRTNRWNCG